MINAFNLLGSGGYLGGNGFPNAVDFNGTSYLTKSGGFSSAVSSNAFIFSFWIKLNTSIIGTPYFLSMVNAAGNVEIIRLRFLSNTIIECRITDEASASNFVQFQGIFATTIVNNWHHVLIRTVLSGTDTADLQIYIDDVNATDGLSWGGNGVSSIPYNASGTVTIASFLGAGGTTMQDMCVAEAWIATTGIDTLTQEATRRKFIDTNKKPVKLGDNGQLPTGSVPLLYLSSDLATWNINKGYGGGMTVQGGALTQCGSRP
ncbi:MAG: hypothetical protein ACKO96_05105 [Flammeovirgaceae bacterium]